MWRQLKLHQRFAKSPCGDFWYAALWRFFL